MSILKSLTLTPALDKDTGNPKRQKLLKRLDVQLLMAKAYVNNEIYTPTKEKFQVDKETGLKTKISVQKNIAKWWKKIDNIYYLQVRYSNKPLELAPKLFNIEINDKAQLVTTLEKLISAVANGELDPLLEKITSHLSKKK
tara:strand:+ start:13966 stop:14388 length:423 start_codon:yes stop_codon:yes gene_type:complete